MAGTARLPVVRFQIRLTPKGGRDGFDGWVEAAGGKGYLKARVTAPPEDGKANDALVRLLAQSLALAKSNIRIVSGASSRLKMIEIDGDETLLSRRLSDLGARQ